MDSAESGKRELESGGETYRLQCMDLWSGNQSVESQAETPAFDLAVYSRPYQGESQGGDVHYVSLCAGGVVTRLILADVSGHGEAVGETSRLLRSLMRRSMNRKSQTGLVRELNREFTRLNETGRFATAVVASYNGATGEFVLCNAGHPRPLWYRAEAGSWEYVSGEESEGECGANLPLGIDETLGYDQRRLRLADGDLLVLYTDAVTECRNGEDFLLGEGGLRRMIEGIPTGKAREAGRELVSRLQQYSEGRGAEDDLTILVLKFRGGRRRRVELREKLRAYARLLRLRSV